MDHLTHEIENARNASSQLAIMYLNLDQFKLINDNLGYHYGDNVLEEMTLRLSKLIEQTGVVAQLGGDEFMILLPITDSEHIGHVCKHLLIEIEQPVYIEEQEIYLTASIGVSVFPEHGDSSTLLMKNANTAMIRSKKRGGSQFFIYHDKLQKSNNDVLFIKNELHKANINEQFILYYQPRIDVKTNKMIGAEALIRWNHPQKGLIPPLDFIPLAEKTTKIIDIGNWVLQTVCNQIKKWQESGYPPLIVSINISARQLNDPNFYSFVTEVLSQSGIEGRWLELEITESLIAWDRSTVIQTLLSIKELGIKITIDDFGTGYSSLNRIHHLPIDSLKIDQTFIRGIELDSNRNIITSIIEIGHRLQLGVVAEGVEEEEQLAFLQLLGCDEWQGYLFSKPLPIVEFEALF